ncbi:hypothetical protein GCM10009819_12050 [Agromyces tropicus]|uniref:CHAP domain-containing protein n=1 Tax=Agromyces tropicus TaxID=555371 RepID=A0ABP5FRD2_9MICO
MPKNFLPPALRRSTYRAPDPATARDFDLTQPPGADRSGDPAERRAAALAAVRADLDLPEPEATRPAASRSTFTPAASADDSTVPDPAEPSAASDPAPVSDATPRAAEASAGPEEVDVVDAPVVATAEAAPGPDSAVPDPAEPEAPRATDEAPSEAGTAGLRTLGGGGRLPRHRADRLGNRRPSSGSHRPLLAACAAFLLGGAVVAGALVSGVDDAAVADAAARDAALADAADSAAADDVVIPPIVQDTRPVVTTGLSTVEAPFTGGTLVTVLGRNLDRVSQVTVAGSPAELVESGPTEVTFEVPAVDDAVRGDAEVVLADAAGSPVDVEVPVASAPASVTTSIDGIVSASEPLPADEVDTAPLTLTYTDDPGIQAQVAYVLAHWSNYNTAEYGVLSGVDCANFASQSLIARGWSMDGAWYYDRGTGQMSSAWSSSTALRDYLRTRTDRATELSDDQREQVKVGDIAQFDWDRSGDRDHTAVVTRVEHTDQGTKVWVGGHTKDADYWDVDVALANGGGTVSYFSLR